MGFLDQPVAQLDIVGDLQPQCVTFSVPQQPLMKPPLLFPIVVRLVVFEDGLDSFALGLSFPDPLDH